MVIFIDNLIMILISLSFFNHVYLKEGLEYLITDEIINFVNLRLNYHLILLLLYVIKVQIFIFLNRQILIFLFNLQFHYLFLKWKYFILFLLKFIYSFLNFLFVILNFISSIQRFYLIIIIHSDPNYFKIYQIVKFHQGLLYF